MKGETSNGGHEPSLTPAQIAADERLEALLDQEFGSSGEDPFPADFTLRLLQRRPFAPWEVRRAAVWKGPLLVFLGLLLASVAAFALPILRLGPVSAIALWGGVTLASIVRPLSSLLASLGGLSEAGAAIRSAAPPAAVLALGAASLGSLAATAFLGRLLGRQSVQRR